MKDIYHLPDDFYAPNERRNSDILVRCYSSQRKSVKNKLVLNMHMINLIVRGQKTVLYPNTTGMVGSGELIILAKGNVLTSEVLSSRGEFKSLIFYFSDQTLQGLLRKNAIDLVPVPGAENWKVYKQDDFIQDFVRTVCLLMERSDAFTDAFRLLKLEELFLYLLINVPGSTDFFRQMALAGTSSDFTAIVESNVATAITIDELAFLCNMSRSTFKRRFEESYGMSPQKWFFEQRMLLAGELLKSGVERPSAVYLKLGYDNHSSFSEAFKKFYGVTPTGYRKG